ncbi:molybdopterin-dependent oxidoreductase, partial [Bartonella saheliensis]|uniref:molybdopterin-dependent oxidoreductase n=1 Tax=Bartonella saheliensis TaxID=1457016 RepID=UPI00119DFE6E
GPLVKTVMTRCIHCTRCVRFTTEVAGISELGLIGRGEDAEITTYLEKAMTSELQGNVIDLCPVGALTSKPYAFHARPWELIKTESIDVMDALGSAIRIDSRGREVMRIMPRTNEDVNEEWISDKTRFIWDGLRTQRLDRPYIRKDGKLQPVSWAEAFEKIKMVVSKTLPEKIGAIAGDLASVEEMYALKALLISLGSKLFDCRQRGVALSPEFGRSSYIFNPTIAGIEQADALLIVGSNPRHEAAVLNARILKRQRMGNFPIALIGEEVDLRYPYAYLGSGGDALKTLIGRENAFFNVLKEAKRPLILIGEGAICGNEGLSVLKNLAKLADNIGALSEEWNGFGILHNAASIVGGLDIGFTSQLGVANILKTCEVLFLLGADEVELANIKAFKIYIGSHGDNGAHAADVILPASTYTEKSGLYVNTEGRVQMTNRAGFAPGEAKEDWAILRALSDVLGQRLPFDSLSQLRQCLFNDYPHLCAIDDIIPSDISGLKALGSKMVSLEGQAFTSMVKDFYLTNPIARASAVMAECSSLAKSRAMQAVE